MAVYFGLGFVLIVVIAELVDLYGVPFTRLSGRVDDFKAEAVGTMTLIADLKEERLRSMLDDYRKTLTVFAGGPWRGTPMQSVLKDVENLTAEGLQDGPLWTRLRQQMAYAVISSRLDNVKRAFPDFRRIFIAEAKSGKIIASTDAADLGADVSGQPCFTRPARAVAISWARCAGSAKDKSRCSTLPAPCAPRRAGPSRCWLWKSRPTWC